MRKTTKLRAILIAAMIECFVSVPAKDYTINYGTNNFAVYAVNTTDGIAKLKGYYDATKTVTTVEIPSKIKYKTGSKTYTLTVTKIGSNAFGGSEPTKVVLPNTIVEIGDLAFHNGTIKTVNIPTKVETIGEQAYRGITFESLKIPATCRSIGTGAFADTKIGSITFASGGTSPLYIGQAAFNKSDITTVFLPARLNKLDYRAFAECRKLQSVTFEGPISEISDWCFMDCPALSYISMPNGTTAICQYAFAGCSSLSDFPWHPSIREIGPNAFEKAGLLAINFNEGLQTISFDAFRGNSKLTIISFPSTLQSIGTESFYGCEAIKDVTSRAIVPPTVYTPSFPVCVPTVPITVPVNSVAAYKAAPGWSRFDYRYYSAIDNVAGDDSPEGAIPAEWYDIQGRRIVIEDLLPGVYIRICGSKTEKIIVK